MAQRVSSASEAAGSTAECCGLRCRALGSLLGENALTLPSDSRAQICLFLFESLDTFSQRVGYVYQLFSHPCAK
jgi:hypothetical protein